jgi:hypothetical protein
MILYSTLYMYMYMPLPLLARQPRTGFVKNKFSTLNVAVTASSANTVSPTENHPVNVQYFGHFVNVSKI